MILLIFSVYSLAYKSSQKKKKENKGTPVAKSSSKKDETDNDDDVEVIGDDWGVLKIKIKQQFLLYNNAIFFSVFIISLFQF